MVYLEYLVIVVIKDTVPFKCFKITLTTHRDRHVHSEGRTHIRRNTRAHTRTHTHTHAHTHTYTHIHTHAHTHIHTHTHTHTEVQYNQT